MLLLRKIKLKRSFKALEDELKKQTIVLPPPLPVEINVYETSKKIKKEELAIEVKNHPIDSSW
jgi:hypothetical protein